MKTLKTFATALLVTLSIGAFAETKTEGENLAMDYTVKTFVDAISHGKVKNLAAVLDSDFKYTITRNNVICNYGKRDWLDFMKSCENVEQNCSTEYKIIEQNQSQSIIKVSMKYEGFTKVNLVNMANTSAGWKITNISTSITQ